MISLSNIELLVEAIYVDQLCEANLTVHFHTQCTYPDLLLNLSYQAAVKTAQFFSGSNVVHDGVLNHSDYNCYRFESSEGIICALVP